jgi:hypothetical protein
MAPGVQSRDDTPSGKGGPARPRITAKVGLRNDSRNWLLERDLSYDCRRPVKRKRALLGSNLPRNSRLETHSDGLGAGRNGPALATWRLPNRELP